MLVLVETKHSLPPVPVTVRVQPDEPLTFKTNSRGELVLVEKKSRTVEIPVYRRCAYCWEPRKGTGVAYSTQFPYRYYRCSMCGYGWRITLRRRVELQESTHTEIVDEMYL